MDKIAGIQKNDQAHVEQKNFTHVRQLLGYGRFGDLDVKLMVDDLYEKAWLPMRNYFTPVLKLISKEQLRKTRSQHDPLSLADEVERRLGEIFNLVEKIEEDRWEEMERAGEPPGGASAVLDSVTARVAIAPLAFTASSTAEKLVKPTQQQHKSNNFRVS